MLKEMSSMKILFKTGNIAKIQSEAIVVNLFEEVKSPGGATGAVDNVIGGAISRLIASGEFTGKLNEIAILRPEKGINAKRVCIVGLGKAKDFNLDVVRQVSAKVSTALRDIKVEEYATIIHGAGIGGLGTKDAAQAVVEGNILALYKFSKYKSNNGNTNEIKSVTIVEMDNNKVREIEKGIEFGKVVGESVCFARNLINTPANEMTPTIMADLAKAAAKEFDVSCKVMDREECTKLGMGSFLAVAKGSDEPPKFITIEYKGKNKASAKTVVLVGKALTFDAGGLSIKTAQGMENMKNDMAGAAVCLATIKAVARLKLPINLICLIAATENLPSGHATRPGDVVRSMSGKTIEILNTDAEGRLTLADGIFYAQRYKPNAILDIATLTGAAGVALGDICCAVMGSSEELFHKLKLASEKTNERIWQLPLWKEYDAYIKSDIADVKNIGEAGKAGTITGGVFLKNFVGNYPWLHIDIAAVSGQQKDKPYSSKGASGFGVRLLTEFLRSF